jgi:hypothetical protein
VPTNVATASGSTEQATIAAKARRKAAKLI